MQDTADGLNGSLGKIAVSGYVDLFDAVLLDELAADGGEFLAKKGLTTGKVEVFNPAEFLRKRYDLVERQIVGLVELLPVKAMLAFHVAE